MGWACADRRSCALRYLSAHALVKLSRDVDLATQRPDLAARLRLDDSLCDHECGLLLLPLRLEPRLVWLNSLPAIAEPRWWFDAQLALRVCAVGQIEEGAGADSEDAGAVGGEGWRAEADGLAIDVDVR